MMQLEQIFGYKPMLAQEKRQELYVVGDLRSLSASNLYMGDKYYIFEDSGFQLHIHEDGNMITGAKIKPNGPTDKRAEVPLNNYEACMAEATADALGIPYIRRN